MMIKVLRIWLSFLVLNRNFLRNVLVVIEFKRGILTSPAKLSKKRANSKRLLKFLQISCWYLHNHLRKKYSRREIVRSFAVLPVINFKSKIKISLNTHNQNENVLHGFWVSSQKNNKWFWIALSSSNQQFQLKFWNKNPVLGRRKDSVVAVDQNHDRSECEQCCQLFYIWKWRISKDCLEFGKLFNE